MAVDTVAPILHKKENSEQKDIVTYLKKIGAGVDDFNEDKRRPRSSKSSWGKNETSITDLKKDLLKFEKFITKDLSNVGLSNKDYKKYVELQTKNLEKFSESLQDSIDEYKDAILSKSGDLSKTDVLNLKKIEQLENKFSQVSPKEKSEDQLEDLKEAIASFITPITQGLDVAGLSGKEKRAYLKKQNKISKEQKEELKESLKEEYDKILSKGVLTEEDKQALKEIGYFQEALQEYGVKQDGFFTKLKDSKAGEGSESLINAMQGLLGPVNLLLQPMQELFNFDFVDMFTGASEFTKKGKKIKPRKSDILKSNPEIIYLANELKGGIEDKTKSKDGEGFSVEDFVMGNMISKLLPAIMSSAVAFIASPAGIALMAVALGALGIKLSGDANQKRREDEARAEMGDFMEETGMSASQVVELRNDIPRSIRGGFSREDVEAKTEQVVEYFKITPEEYLKYVEEDPNNIGEKEEYISYIKDYIAKKNSERVVDEEAETINKAEIPEPPKFHDGGFVPGNKNEEVPSILLGGEYVKSHKEIEFDKTSMAINLHEIRKSFNQQSNNDVVKSIEKLITTVKNKPFNNVINNIEKQNNDFDRLRVALL